MAPLVYSALAVQGVTISPTDIPSGGTATGTVTLDAVAIVSTKVFLSSNNPSVATVPAGVVVGTGTKTSTFTVNAPIGAAGCTTIDARVGLTGTAKGSGLLFVEPPLPTTTLILRLSPTTVLTTRSASGQAFLRGATPGAVVRLTSSNPNVTVPPSVTLTVTSEDALVGTFNITTSAFGATTCAVITATFGTSKTRALLKVTGTSG